MFRKILYRITIFFASLLVLLTVDAQDVNTKYELRAAWVATVVNIDWPSKAGLTSRKQKREVIETLDLLKSMGLNAVIVQVRPAADAFYKSKLEPWSRYISGEPGIEPKPFYDPLEFWVEECHTRGMEFHAWFNPYRVAQNYKEKLDGNHIAFQHPDWILKYGDKLYFDPGLPETRKFVTKVVVDVVSRYDVDAIHFDDYFYPYPLKEEFPDTVSFRKFARGWSSKYKADWRRENVDLTIKMLNKAIKETKPWVKFGISPFGVWRNKRDDQLGSDTKVGATNYDDLFADVIKWQEKGWIDYLMPQLYWRIGHPLVDFKTLAHWWEKHTYGRGMFIGHGVYRVDQNSKITEWTQPGQLVKQINILRQIPKIGGSAFYSSKHFKRNLLGFQDSLRNNYYRKPAIIPVMQWLDSIPPPMIKNFKKWGKKIKWEVVGSVNEMDKQARFVIYLNEKDATFDPGNSGFIKSIVVSNKFRFKRINKKRKEYEVRISALDRLNNESKSSESVIIKL